MGTPPSFPFHSVKWTPGGNTLLTSHQIYGMRGEKVHPADVKTVTCHHYNKNEMFFVQISRQDTLYTIHILLIVQDHLYVEALAY